MFWEEGRCERLFLRLVTAAMRWSIEAINNKNYLGIYNEWALNLATINCCYSRSLPMIAGSNSLRRRC